VATKTVRLPLVQGNAYLRRVRHRIRRDLEARCLEVHGEIGIVAASRIATATTAIAQAMRCERVLASAGEPGAVATSTKTEGNATAVTQKGLTHPEWLAYSDRILKYRESADRALAALGLDRRTTADIYDQLYATPRAAATPQLPHDLDAKRPERQPAGQDAPDAKPDALPGIQAKHEDMVIPGSEAS